MSCGTGSNSQQHVSQSAINNKDTYNGNHGNPSKRNKTDDGNDDTEPPSSSGIDDTYPSSDKETLPSFVPSYTLKFPTLPSCSVLHPTATSPRPDPPAAPSDGYQSDSSSFDLFSNSDDGDSAVSDVIAPSGVVGEADKVTVLDMDSAAVVEGNWKSMTGEFLTYIRPIHLNSVQ